MNILLEEHLKILSCLLKHEVDFMLIGGYAVIYYGYKRTTGDMDLWLKPSNENKRKLCDALTEAGFETEDIIHLESLDFEQTLVFSLGTEPQKIDFLTRISLVDYETANQNKIVGNVDSLKLPVIQLHDLIRSKMSTGRLKDAADIDELQRINQLKP